eukprot:COSAG02_NODE_12860_length_1481_cov_1.044139_3_plen_95_part_00
MCGLLEGGGQPHTICGSLAQVDNGYYLLGGQTDKGSSNWADPLGFGTANLPALALTPLDKCTSASAEAKTSQGLGRATPLVGLALVMALLAGVA